MDTGEQIKVTKTELEKLPKLCRKSWRIRVIRYGEFLPDIFFQLSPNTHQMKSLLKLWVRNNIPPDGDFIFKGKIEKKRNNDWLSLEVEKWRNEIEDELISYEEWKEIEEHWEMANSQ